MAECLTSSGQAKRRYPSRAAAKRALRQQRQAGIDNTGQAPYRCSKCRWFHLGHYPVDPEARRGMRARHRTDS